MIKSVVIDGKTYAQTSDLKVWEKNPRDITEVEFEKLKESLAAGQLHNLVVNQDGIVLGGNMRLRAYQAMNYDQVWVEIVETKTEKEMFDIAMRSNMSSGFYSEEKLNRLAVDLKLSDIELKHYTLHLGEPKTLDLVVNGPDFDAESDNEDDRLDKTKEIECPHCGEVFTP